MNKKGFLLLEYSVALMFICLLLSVFYDNFIQSIDTYRKIVSDLEIYRAERGALSMMKEEMGFYVDTVQVFDEAQGYSLITGKETAAKRKISYYCNESPDGDHVLTLYQKTQVEGKSAGINPLTPPSIEVTEWKAERISDRNFLLTIGIRECSSGRERKFFEVVYLCNGKVL